MTKLEDTQEKPKRVDRVEGVTKTDRTRVIILSQVVTIVALLILWSIIRARRPNA
jgi:hypothetical protein